MRGWPTGRTPLLDLAGLRIESSNEAARKVAVVDGAVRTVCDSPRPCSLVRQDNFGDVERFGIDLSDLVTAKLAKVGSVVWSNDNSIGQRLRRCHFFERDLAVPGIQFADKVTVLSSEEDHPLSIKYEAVRITCARIGHRVFSYIAGARIELADIRFEIRREPDVAVFISGETVRAGVRHFQRIFLNLASFRIQPTQFIC